MTKEATIKSSISWDTLLSDCPEWYQKLFADLVPRVITAQIQQFTEADTHKQSRQYLKTMGALTGRESGKETIFSNPCFDPSPELRNKIPKITAIIGAYLIREYQRCGDDWLIIENLSEAARVFNTSPRRFKQHLVLLGGYEYVTVERVKRKGKGRSALELSQRHLFDITFGMDIPEEEAKTISESLLVGTAYAAYIKERNVLYVKARPAKPFREDIGGSSTNFIRTVDNIIQVFLSLNDMAFKLACFAISNQPTWEVSVRKLAEPRFLNIESQIEEQGYPRILGQLKRALEQLLITGLFNTASCEPIPGKNDHQLRWEYSTDMIKHDPGRKRKSSKKVGQ